MEKVVLAYSGGLDTSVILSWLARERNLDVYVYIADVGQKENFSEVVRRARSLGVAEDKIFLHDIKDEFIENYYCRAARANAVYEYYYLMGTPIARPAIAKGQVEFAHRVGARLLAHGCTQKGNDQLRFELAYLALDPTLEVIAPWREWGFRGRSDLVNYAQQNGIDWIGCRGYSRDENLLHVTAEGEELENPGVEPKEAAWKWTVSPIRAPDRMTDLSLTFEAGIPVALDGDRANPRFILERLNALGAENGIGRLDIIDNRLTGVKSRGLFEAPGATIWTRCHRAMESLTLTKEQMHLSAVMAAHYSTNIYNGLWFSPETKAMDSFFATIQKDVEGEVAVGLYKGNIILRSITSPKSLFLERESSFEDSEGFSGPDATGFIKLFGKSLKIYHTVRRNGQK